MKPAQGRTITVVEHGPYLVCGDVPLANQHIVTNAQGESIEWREGEAIAHPREYALCRCGRSARKPFCDGTHERVAFDGTETASRMPFENQARELEGPEMVLEDAEHLCALARFCDPHGQVWNLVARADQPHVRQLVEHEAGHCPAGRLVARDRATGDAVEPHFEPSIGLVQDTARGISGPIWVRGGIPIVGADGGAYEVRNRVTLCRCGVSSNKPFCDGAHVPFRFNDRE
ncbi:MAG TPA: CDGSH iron-sulfur domain-containing protein [Thermoanaerobaculaceae bacterium]|nr:CDGSH iron-sulfur domain-containing protein [Thermoanaerobaculaceae bacterium]